MGGTISLDTLEAMRKSGATDDAIADHMAQASPSFASQVSKIRQKFGGDPAATTAYLNSRFYGMTDHTPEAPKGFIGRSLDRIYDNYRQDMIDIGQAKEDSLVRQQAAGPGVMGAVRTFNAKTDELLQTAGNVASIGFSPLSQPFQEGVSTVFKGAYENVPGVKATVDDVMHSDLVQKGIAPAAKAISDYADEDPAMKSTFAVGEGLSDFGDAVAAGAVAKGTVKAVKAIPGLPKAAAKVVSSHSPGFIKNPFGAAKAAPAAVADDATELIGPAKEAISKGMDERLMRFTASQNPDTRSAMAQMTRMAKQGSEKLGGDTAHKEVLGGYIMNNMAHILETKQNVGKAIGAMKMGMADDVIDLTDDYMGFLQMLNDKGAVIGKGGKITRLMGASDDNIPLLQQALDFLQPDDSGRVLRKFKQTDMWRQKMFQEMNSAKSKLAPSSAGQSAFGFAETAVNRLRRAAINKMAKNNPRFLAYNDAFENLSTESSKFLKTIGYKGKLSVEDITAKELRAGEVALQTLGNASADKKDAFKSMLQTARRYGYSSNVDEMKLITYADELENIFPITPTRSLQGHIKRGTRDALGSFTEDVVRGAGPGRAVANRAADAIMNKIDSMRGLTPENRFRLLMEVLEAPPETPLFQIIKKVSPDAADDIGKKAVAGIDAQDIAPLARERVQSAGTETRQFAEVPLSRIKPPKAIEKDFATKFKSTRPPEIDDIPIDVIKEGDSYRVVDGVHRLAAALKRGDETIRINVLEE